jgi:hypothetical protein
MTLLLVKPNPPESRPPQSPLSTECSVCGSSQAFMGFTDNPELKFCPSCMPGLSDTERLEWQRLLK